MAARSFIRKTGINGIYNESDEIMAGQIIFCASTAIPNGYLECNGATVSRTTYATLFAAIGVIYGAGDGATTFKLPDLRGEFLRGADRGRGVDVGRAVASYAADKLREHSHVMAVQGVDQSDGYMATKTVANVHTYGATGGVSGGAGANETAPRNCALVPVIKYS